MVGVRNVKVGGTASDVMHITQYVIRLSLSCILCYRYTHNRILQRHSTSMLIKVIEKMYNTPNQQQVFTLHEYYDASL